MPRPCIQLLGPVEEQPELAGFLRAAGYEVRHGPGLGEGVEVALLVGAALARRCQEARGVAPWLVLLAWVERIEDVDVAELLAAGADDVLLATLPRPLLLARLGAAVDQAALRARLAAERERLAFIDEVSACLSDTALFDLIEGLYEISVKLTDHFNFDRCTVLVPSETNSDTLFVVAASDEPALARLPVDLRKYPELRIALERREPLYIEDVARSPLLGRFAATAATRGGRSQLLVPLSGAQGALGLLWLRSIETRPAPGQAELELLVLLGRLVGLALRHGGLDALRETTQHTSWTAVKQRSLRGLTQYRDFFESSSDGMLVVDALGEVLYMNRAAEQLTGFARSGLVGRSIGELVPEPLRAGLGEAIAQVATGMYIGAFDLELLTTSGEPLRVSVSSSRIVHDDGVVALTFRDVTLARLLEEELRKTKDFLERLIDSTVDAIVAADTRGQVIIFNRGAERLFGFSAEEILYRIPVWQLYPEGEARRIMAELRVSEHGGQGRLMPTRREIVNRQGERVPVMLSAAIIYEDGEPVGTVGILSDMRERLRIEQRLAQAQEKLQVTEKQALIADLAGTIAHELNQPLTSVLGYAELLKRRMDPGDPKARAIDTILSEAERMATLVRKLGKITRYETKPYIGSTQILDLDKSTTDG